MKSILYIFAFIFLAGNLHAQHFSFGARGGITSWMHLNNKFHGSNKAQDFHQECFGRYQYKTRWAFEISAGRDVYNEHWLREYSYSGEDFTELISEKYESYQVSIAAQYELNMPCHCAESCNWHNRIRSFIGITLSPTFKKEYTKEDYSNGQRNNYDPVYDNSVWTGFTHTTVIRVSNHLQVSGAAHFLFEPFRASFLSSDRFDNSGTDARFLFTLGAGYSF